MGRTGDGLRMQPGLLRAGIAAGVWARWGGAGSKNRTKVLRAGVGEVSVRGRDQYFGGCYGA